MKYVILLDKDNTKGKLHRIKAIKDFGNIKAGTIGGWIEKENNLSQEGNCWVYDEAEVFDNARVIENAYVYDRAKVFENAIIKGNSAIYGNSKVYNNARISDFSNISGSAEICKNANLLGATIINSGIVYQSIISNKIL